VNKKTFYILFVPLLLLGCAVDKNLKPRNVEDYYTSTGVEKYFLTDVPAWASFDQNAGCFRTPGIRYFNIDALMKSYALTYNQALQIQGSFNEEFVQYKKVDKSKAPSFKEEELLFYKVVEKVSSKIHFFTPPEFKRIHFIWIDEILGDERKEKKLKQFLNSSTMDLGVPVMVSFCMTREEIEKKFPDLSSKLISAELFSIYDRQGVIAPGFKFDLEQFFGPAQELYFYSQKILDPSYELKGSLKILNY